MRSDRGSESNRSPSRVDKLSHLPQAEFVAAWVALVGEPPATMLESRSAMIRLLVDSAPIAPIEGQGVFGRDERD